MSDRPWRDTAGTNLSTPCSKNQLISDQMMMMMTYSFYAIYNKDIVHIRRINERPVYRIACKDEYRP